MSNKKTTVKNKAGLKLDSNLVSLSPIQVKERLIEMIKDKALFESDSVLPSGKITTHYLDLKEVLLSAEGAFLASMALLANLKDEVRSIGGIFENTYSLAVSTSQLAYLRGQEVDTFLVKEDNDARRKGFSKWVLGPLKPGAKVCLIQDEVLDGRRVIETVRKLQEEADVQIIQIISIVDREDGAKLRLQDYGVDYTSIISMSEIAEPLFV